LLPIHTHSLAANDGGALSNTTTQVSSNDGSGNPFNLAAEIDNRQANVNFFNNSRNSTTSRYGQYLAVELVFS
jgi:hypothetical protein